MNACGSLGAMFRRAREEKNMTQEQVGGLIGMGANGYGKLERGINQIPTDLVVPLCRILGVSLIDAMHVMAGGLEDGDEQSFHAFPDMGASVGFSPEEWQMHLELCRFAGIDDACGEEAYAISSPVITARRMRLVLTYKEESYHERNETDQHVRCYDSSDGEDVAGQCGRDCGGPWHQCRDGSE